MRVIYLSISASFLFAGYCLAQSGMTNGGIRGVISDASGAAVTHAKVISSNLQTGFERSSESNNRGEYELPLLPIGSYKISINVPGFSAFEQTGITVELDKSSTLNVSLQVGSTQQSVSVQADASILNTQTFDVSGNVNEKSMENMPISSRNTFNLALFAPGLNGSRDDEFGNPTFAFGGMQRKAFLVDGIDNTQRGGPGRLGIFSPETIQEVKVISNAMAAEYGRTVGGMISMVTRGGSNDTHGEGLVLLRRPGFIARGSLAPQPKPFQQWAVYNANIGGHIIKDKLFYFVSGEYEPEDGPRAITITPSDAAALKIPASDLGTAPFKQRFQTYLGRLDYQFNSNNNFYVRYSNFVTPSQYNTSGGLSVKSASNNFDDRNDTFASQWTSILGASTINEARFGFLRREFTRPPSNGVVGPIISITNVAQLGSNSSADQYYTEDQYNFIDQLSHRWGRHELKFGIDLDTIHVISQDRLLLQYTFSNLAQYLNTLAGVTNPATGRPWNYTQLQQDFGNNTAEHRTTPINLFAQDDFHVRPNLTISYGLRWEYRVFPSLQSNAPLAIDRSIPGDYANFAPRFGFAYSPGQKTVVRGGYGIFYDTLNLRLISLADRQNGLQVLRYTISGTDPSAPQYPNAFTAANASFLSKPSLTGFAGDFKTTYAHQANLQVEQEIIPNLSVTAGLQYYGGRKLPLLIDTNLGPATGVLADGRLTYAGSVRPNLNYNQVFALESIANSTYYGGFVSVNKRFSSGLQCTAAYTLGWAFNVNDSVGDNGNNAVNSGNLKRDYGFSSSDQRHRFVLQGVWQPAIPGNQMTKAVVNGWTLAPNFTVTSAFPFTPIAGTDLNGDGVNNDYALFHSRNDTRGYGFRELNLRLSRTFSLPAERYKLEIIGEAENLLNSTNAACNAGGCGGAVNTTLSSPTFKRITGAFNSRQIQLGGRIRF